MSKKTPDVYRKAAQAATEVSIERETVWIDDGFEAKNAVIGARLEITGPAPEVMALFDALIAMRFNSKAPGDKAACNESKIS